MNTTVQSILRDYVNQKTPHLNLPLHKLKAITALIKCRTAALGGHVQRCPEGHVERIWYNSCKHRYCPQCQGLETARWLEQQQRRLLPCPHFHVIFTLPHQLLPFWQSNSRLMAQLLFRSASQTLLTLLSDPRFLGATPGILACLHTWGRNLSLHPHLHCIVTAGGLQGDQWIGTKKDYLLPFQVVRSLYRGKLIAALRQALKSGQLQAPPSFNAQKVENLFNKLGRRVKWHVHLERQYAHGNGVLKYLSRYIKGGPINNSQLGAVNDQQLVFRFTDHRSQNQQQVLMQRGQFIQRLLWHINEPGQHSLRYYGLYHGSKQPQRNLIRQQLGDQPEAQVNPPLSAERYLSQCGQLARLRCPVCQRVLVTEEVLTKPQRPP